MPLTPAEQLELQQLEQKFAARAAQQSFQSDPNAGLRAFATGAADSASFGYGDELAAKVDQMRGMGDYNTRLAYHRANLAEAQKDPVASITGSVVGAIPTAIMGGAALAGAKGLPILGRVADAATKFATARPAVTASLLGASGANLYTSGSSTEADPAGPLDYALATTLGVGGGMLGSAIGGAVSKGTQNAANKLERVAGRTTKDAIADSQARILNASQQRTDGLATAGILNPAQSYLDDNTMTPATGTILPMVKGVAEGNKDVMRSVLMAKRGLLGTKAEDAVTAIEQGQQNKLRGILGQFGAEEVDPYAGASDVGGILQKAYSSAREKTGAAYKALREVGTDVRYSPESTQLLNENLIKSINPFKVGIEAGTLPNASAVYKTLASRVGKADLSPAELIDLRTQINGLVSKGATTPDDAALLSIKGGVDNFLDNAIGDALVNGDDKVIQLYKQANEARKIQGKLFEDNTAIFDLVRSRDLQPENVANVIFGAGLGKKGKNASGTTGQIVRDLLAATGDNAPEARELLRKGIMSRVLSRSVSGDTVSPAKLATNLDEIFRNQPTLRDQLFDASEIERVTKLQGELNQLVRSEARDIGSTSGSGEAAPRILMKLLKATPVVGNTIDLASSAGEDLAKNKAKKILEKDIAASMNAAIAKFNSGQSIGALIGGQSAGQFVAPNQTRGYK